MSRMIYIASAGVLVLLAGCDRPTRDAPPSVRLGESVCAECNMILSDIRWVTATIIDGPRGPEPRLFDDFNCQVNYESEHANEVILTRWSHDFVSSRWIPTADATFLISSELRTPMGSHVAAFETQTDAETTREQYTGQLEGFVSTWTQIAANSTNGSE